MRNALTSTLICGH